MKMIRDFKFFKLYFALIVMSWMAECIMILFEAKRGIFYTKNDIKNL